MRAEAEGDAEEQMSDLLVCLGQEEAKVEALRQKLEDMGMDVDAILAGIDDDEEEEDEQQDNGSEDVT